MRRRKYMKEFVLTGIGIAVGVGLFEIAIHGFAGADWYRVVFVGIVAALLLAAIKALRNRASS